MSQQRMVFFNLAWISGLLILIVNRSYPFVGHDYTYFVSRLLDTDLHYRINGLSIHWFTPSFGGGLPSYANPQQMQFSLVQLLTLFFNPWLSINLAIVLYFSIGFMCFFAFAKNSLALEWRASLLGASFFTGTGFYIGHMISGQLGFLGFPLFSAILLVLFIRRWSDLASGVVIGLLTASLMYQAGFYTLVIFALAGGISLPLLYLIKPDVFSLPTLIKRLSLAASFFVALSLSKLYAVYTFMRYFPRQIQFEYSADYLNTPLQPLASFIAQLLGTTLLAPLMSLAGQDVDALQFILSNLSGYPYSGLWETDNALSPALLGVLVIGLARQLQIRPKNRFVRLSKGNLIALVILFCAVWFTFEFTVARGVLYSITQRLPILSSLHINFRFTAAFYFPLALVGAVITSRWLHEQSELKAQRMFLLLNLVTLASPLAYFLYSPEVHDRRFDLATSLQTYQQIRQGETFPVTTVADKRGRDWDAIAQGFTTTTPYEPIFGYDLADFTPRIHPGPVSDITDGFYNLTNPASLTNPAANGGELFSLFAASDGERFEQFTHRQQPDWNLPAMQILFNSMSLIACIVALLAITIQIVPGVWRQKTEAGSK